MASFPLCEQLRKRDIPFMMLKKPVDDHEFGRALADLARLAEIRRARGPSAATGCSSGSRRPTWQALQPHLEHVA